MFLKGETKTDVASYFFQTYGRRLQYPFMPCVVTGRDVFLPMEICTVLEVNIKKGIVSGVFEQRSTLEDKTVVID